MQCRSDVDEPAYAYLLGQYLGDGCISQARRHVFRLRIATCDDYPEIRAECEADIRWLFVQACIYLEIEFRYTKPNTISVAQGESVAKLDSFVGPKR
jgi:hypothetical protein